MVKVFVLVMVMFAAGQAYATDDVPVIDPGVLVDDQSYPAPDQPKRDIDDVPVIEGK